ncbi:MAG: DUF805 domain-containing protein [Phenylobacterium sp.]|nr:DUF805 domain-containing protein [Phenylobacterium sp.]
MDKVLSYFSFAGRANRQRYWLTSFAIYGLIFVGLLVGLLIGGAIPVVGPVLLALMVVAAMWASLAISARRLHDRNKSAWWLLLFIVLPTLLSAFGQLVGLSEPEAGAAFSLLGLPFSIWALVEIGCLKGTIGPNRFGADPLQPSLTEVFG